MAMLPEDWHFRYSFSDYFIIFKPRDIVSGDFYWIDEDEKHIFLLLPTVRAMVFQGLL